MSLLRRSITLQEAADYGDRSLRSAAPAITARTARSHSVAWGAKRLRANLISMMPVDVYRQSKAAGVATLAATPAVLRYPTSYAEGHPTTIAEHLYASQWDLDDVGNAIGVIRKFDALGKPAEVELVQADLVSATVRGGRVQEYRINGERHEPRLVWHERQYLVGGVPFGLSPLAHAALQLAGGLSAQQFAVDWFSNGAVPAGVLRNIEQTIPPADSDKIKRRLKATMVAGDIFVTGKDWEYSAIAAKAAETQFIEAMAYSDQATVRFYDVPADLLDVPVEGASRDYANVTQRFLQTMVMHLGPAVKRRNDALSMWLPDSYFVRLNTDAVLAMDPKMRAEVFEIQVRSRTRTPDEARAKDDVMPLTEADYKQFDRLFGARTPNQPQTSGGN